MKQPLLLAHSLLAGVSQLRKVGGATGISQLLHVSPQHFSGMTVKGMNPLSLKPFLCSFTGMPLVIITHFCSSVYSWWQESLAKNLLMGLRHPGSKDITQFSIRWSFITMLLYFSRRLFFFSDMQWWFLQTWWFQLRLNNSCPENGLHRRPLVGQPPITVMAVQLQPDCRGLHSCPRC